MSLAAGTAAWAEVCRRAVRLADLWAYRSAFYAAEEIMAGFAGVHARPVPVRDGGWGLAVSTGGGSVLQTTDRERARAWAADHSSPGGAPSWEDARAWAADHAHAGEDGKAHE